MRSTPCSSTRPRAGFALLVTVVLLSLMGLVLAGLARGVVQRVVDADAAAEALQERYTRRSLEAVLEAAPSLLDAANGEGRDESSAAQAGEHLEAAPAASAAGADGGGQRPLAARRRVGDAALAARAGGASARDRRGGRASEGEPQRPCTGGTRSGWSACCRTSSRRRGLRVQPAPRPARRLRAGP